LFGSLSVFVHSERDPSGHWSGVEAGQASHTPGVVWPQVPPSGQLLPHEPQLLTSVFLSTQVPLQRSGVGLVQLDTQVCDDELQNVLIGQLTAFWQVEPHEVLLSRSLQTPPQLTWPVGQHRPASLCVPVGQHLPASQLALAPHVMPHAPQFCESVCGLLQLPLQLLSPDGQHRRFVQVSPVLQLSAQLEQCELVPRFWHVPPQLSWFVPQQMPKSQVPAPQPLPQLPQLSWSSSGLMHWPLQNSSPLAQIDLHVPAWQLVPAPQMLPHAPQLKLSESGLLQVPLQFSVPVAQHTPLSLNVPVGQHLPALHAALAPHELPHMPQLLLSVSGLLQVPPQFSVPEPQHTPLSHDWPVPHALPHMPQLLLSVSGLLQVPPQFSVLPPQHTP
jgi:hypothetical protein